MRGGNLRHRISLVTATLSQATSGGVAYVWDPPASIVASVPANVVEGGGGESLRGASQVEAVASVTVEIRYRPGVTAQQRVHYGSRVLKIIDVSDPDNRQRRLLLLCREVR